MIRYILKKNNNQYSPVFGKIFAYPIIEETVELEGLAEHMAKHNTPYSEGAIKGVLIDIINCIHELMLEGKNVKLPNLAIFSIGIRNAKGGAESEEEFTVTKSISSVKLCSRATGDLTAKSLNLDATLKRAFATMKLAATREAARARRILSRKMSAY